MRETRSGCWAAALGAILSGVIAYAWCSVVLEFGGWPALGAGVGCAILVFAALGLAVRRARSGRSTRGRAIGAMTLAGLLMLLVGLLALLLPGVEPRGLLLGVGLGSAALYFGAVLFELLRGRGRGAGP